ncbi:MAG: lysozyme, partial [Rhizobium altiplani]
AELAKVWARGNLLPAREPDPPLILAKIEMEPRGMPAQGPATVAQLPPDPIVTSSILQSGVVRTRRDF